MTTTSEDGMREKWALVGNSGYAISSLGNVAGIRKNRMKPQITVHGYARICIIEKKSKKYKTIHSLVTEAFIGPRPDGMTINHKDGDKLNNRLDNLEYITVRENLEHAWANGKKCQGDTHGRRKLTSAQVEEIRSLYKRGNRRDLAKRYGVCKEHITKILTGRNWGSLISKAPERSDDGGLKS